MYNLVLLDGTGASPVEGFFFSDSSIDQSSLLRIFYGGLDVPRSVNKVLPYINLCLSTGDCSSFYYEDGTLGFVPNMIGSYVGGLDFFVYCLDDLEVKYFGNIRYLRWRSFDSSIVERDPPLVIEPGVGLVIPGLRSSVPLRRSNKVDATTFWVEAPFIPKMDFLMANATRLVGILYSRIKTSIVRFAGFSDGGFFISGVEDLDLYEQILLVPYIKVKFQGLRSGVL